MIRSDALRVMRKIAAYQPSLRLDDLSAEAFAEALAPHDVRDALEAVGRLCTAPRRAGEPWLVELRDIVTELGRVEHERERARIGHLEPPPETADNPAAYQAWLAHAARLARSRDWEQPAPLAPGSRHPAIAALTETTNLNRSNTHTRN